MIVKLCVIFAKVSLKLNYAVMLALVTKCCACSVDALVTGLQQLEREHEHLRGVDSWWPSMQRYAVQERNFSHWTEFATEEQFPMLLSDFLYSSHGAKYKSSFKEEFSALVVFT